MELQYEGAPGLGLGSYVGSRAQVQDNESKLFESVGHIPRNLDPRSLSRVQNDLSIILVFRYEGPTSQLGRIVGP
jgi:hypothetical protein